MKILLSCFVIALSLQVPAGRSQSVSRGETGWIIYSRTGRIVQMYKIDKVSKHVVYARDRFYLDGKLIPGPEAWNVDCKGYVMHGRFVTWLKKGSLWVSERGNKPASPGIEEKFDLFCSHAFFK